MFEMPFEIMPPSTGVSSTSATLTPNRAAPMAAPIPPELPPTTTTSYDCVPAARGMTAASKVRTMEYLMVG